MTDTPLPQPAPVWRRLVALMYDLLLYVALLMAGLVLSIPVVSALVATSATSQLQNYHVLTAYGIVVGAIFFGYSWTHGGQTLGMRVWKLQLRDARSALPPRWPQALLRFALAYAGVVAALWLYRRFGAQAVGLPLLGYVPALLDARARSLWDWLAGTEIMQLSANPVRGTKA